MSSPPLSPIPLPLSPHPIPSFHLETTNKDEDSTTQPHGHGHGHAQLIQSFHLPSINASLLIRLLPSQGLSFQLWPAAFSLVSLLDHDHPHHSTIISSCFPSTTGPHRPLRILELGSGTGLVGIAAAALLGASVTVTDLPHVLPNMQHNIDANAGVMGIRGGAVEAASLPWGDVRHMEGIIGKEFDVILGSDVVYHDHLYEPLVETLKYFLLGNGGEKKLVFLMAHLKRWKKESVFFKKARKFFDVRVVHTDPPIEGSRVGVCLYKFVRKGVSI